MRLDNVRGTGQDYDWEVRKDGRRRNIEKRGRLKLPLEVRDGNVKFDANKSLHAEHFDVLTTHEVLDGHYGYGSLKVEIAPPELIA